MLSTMKTKTTTQSTDAECAVSHIRLKVDRQLLSSMMKSVDPLQPIPPAVYFFLDVGDKSGSIISYPRTRRLLELGPKDPEILLIGSQEQVEMARSLIMDTLDPFRNRVTLKIDVSHKDHSHVIGKNGKRIQSIMDATETHIHFPDGNRSNSEMKSNQVTIAGTSLRKAEEARHLVRQNLPLTVCFPVDVSAKNMTLLDSTHPTIQYYQMSYGVIITFRNSEEIGTVMPEGVDWKSRAMVWVCIRGTRIKFEDIKEAAFALYQYLTDSAVGFNSIVTTIIIEIAAQHHLYVKGKSNCNIKAITAHTGAMVQFPQQMFGSPSTLQNQHNSSTVVIRGLGVESAFMAWIELLGYLPVLLVFDVRADLPIDGRLITSLMANEMLSIFIRPKPRTNVKTIAIKAQERYSQLLYKARQMILNMKVEEMQAIRKPPIDATFSSSLYPMKAKSFTELLNTEDMEPEVLRGFDN